MNTEVNPNTGTLKGAWDDYISRIKSGDMGALPGVLGLIALCIVFGVMSDVFLTPGNFANLLTQAASVTVIAMGLVFVLLLGEIDLSAGYASGVCGAVLVILITNHGYPWWIALAVSIVVGAILGYTIGTMVSRLGIPSFVVTLAAFLMFQGLLLLLAGEGGTIRIEDPTILAVQNNNLSPLLSWAFFVAVSAIYVLIGLARINSRRKAGLKSELKKLWAIKTAALLVIGVGAVWALNLEKALLM
ncbi:MAG: hypothetical protein RLZ15_994 [Actinomycetota bacterium]